MLVSFRTAIYLLFDSCTDKEAGVFIGEAGAANFVVISLAWQVNNIRGDAKRAVATAFIVMASGIGSIYSSLVFRQQVSSFLIYSDLTFLKLYRMLLVTSQE